MLHRNIFIGFVVLTLICSSLCAFAAEAVKPIDTPSFSVTGAAVNIDQRDEFFNISNYMILANRATVQLNNGKFGTLRDLKDNAQVNVLGEQLSARTILASTIIVLDDSGSYVNSGTSGYRPNDRVETDGYVTRVDTQMSEIDIRTRAGSYVLVVRPETVIRRYIYVTDIKDVSDGDDIKLVGTVDREGKIIAERIHVSASNAGDGEKYTIDKISAAVSSNTEDTIEGAILYPSSAFDRSLVLETRYGERKVEVPKDAEVIIDAQPGSVHSLVKSDKLRTTGVWNGTTLVASRIELVDQLSAAAQSDDPPVKQIAGTITGRIVELNSATYELIIDAAMKDNKISAREASLTSKGSTIQFSSLKKGDEVEVKGQWAGDVLVATAVDVVE